MPRPPIFELPDWKAIFEAGRDFDAWKQTAEDDEQRQKLQQSYDSVLLEATTKAALVAIPKRVHVVCFAECWCGDVVRHVPVLQRMAETVPEKLAVRYVMREEAPDAFKRHLTHGGEAIPKFIFCSEAFGECISWGPMPEACKRLISRGKACDDVDGARRLVSARYAADPARREVVEELWQCIEVAAAGAIETI